MYIGTDLRRVLVHFQRQRRDDRGRRRWCLFNSPNFNSPNSGKISIRRISTRRISIQVRIRVRIRVRVRVRVSVRVRVRVFGELKFGELKRNPHPTGKGVGHVRY